MKHIYTLLVLTALLLTGCKDNPVESSSSAVRFANPLNNELVGDSALITLNVVSPKGITGVEFYINGTLTKSWVAPPFTYYCQLGSFADSSRQVLQAKAKLGNGEEIWSLVKSVTVHKLKAPAELGVTFINAHTFKLSWSDNNTAETGYRIDVNKNKTGFTPLATVPANTTEYSITNTDTLLQHEYRIAAVRESNISSFSGTVALAYSVNNYITVASVKASNGTVNDMVLSPDRNSIWCAGSDGYVKQISLTDASVLKSVRAHNGSAEVICIKSDGSSVFTSGTDKKLIEWSTASGTLLQQTDNLPVTLMALSISSDNSRLVASATTPFAYVYSTASLSTALQVQGDNIATLWSMASPAENYFITFGFGGYVRFYSFNDGTLLRTQPTTIGKFGDFCPDGSLYVMPDGGNSISFINTTTGQKALTAAGHQSTISWLKYSPDSYLLGSIAEDKSIKVWKTYNGVLYCNVTGETDKVTRLLFTANGSKLITCGTDGIIRIRQHGSGWYKQ